MNKRQFGSVTIESALGITILLGVFLSWIEVCVLTYSMSMTDIAFSRAVSNVKKIEFKNDQSIDYKSEIKKFLYNEGGALWNSTIEKDDIYINVNYFNKLEQLISCYTESNNDDLNCVNESQEYKNKALAVYELSYIYDPSVSFWFPEMNISREIISIQEYERNLYK